MYEGPAETGSVAISAPIAGPERSVIIEAITTNAAATAMRRTSERRKASSGDIVRWAPAVHSLAPLAGRGWGEGEFVSAMPLTRLAFARHPLPVNGERERGARPAAASPRPAGLA